jgi:hypothetical protein
MLSQMYICSGRCTLDPATGVPPDYQLFYFKVGENRVQMHNATSGDFCLKSDDSLDTKLLTDIAVRPCEDGVGRQWFVLNHFLDDEPPLLENQYILTVDSLSFGSVCARVRNTGPPPQPGPYVNTDTVVAGSCTEQPVTDVVSTAFCVPYSKALTLALRFDFRSGLILG